MEKMQARAVLMVSIVDAKEIYPRDVMETILAGEAEGQTLEADTLFRSLVLDEGWPVDRAKRTFEAALLLIQG